MLTNTTLHAAFISTKTQVRVNWLSTLSVVWLAIVLGILQTASVIMTATLVAIVAKISPIYAQSVSLPNVKLSTHYHRIHVFLLT